MNKICEHEQAVLLYVLNFAASNHRVPTVFAFDNWDTVVDCVSPVLIRNQMIAGKDTSLSARQVAAKRAAAWFDIHDPAKLAEMLAERGRQLGFGAYYGRLVSPERYPLLVFTHVEIEVHIRIAADRSEFGAYSFVRTYLMPSVRALLAAWLELPDGDREGAEKALKGAS